MMHNPLFAVLLAAPLSLAALQPNPRILPNALVARQSFSLNPRLVPHVLLARQSCSSEGQATCEDSCMPTDAVCCDDGSSTYCPFGEYCVTGGCCPKGETCDGSGGGTMTIFNEPTSVAVSTPTTSVLSGGSGSGSCSSEGLAVCEQSCMPTNGVCCDDGSGTYCPSGEYCVTGGCCPKGETCDGSGGGTLTLDVPSATSTSVSDLGSHLTSTHKASTTATLAVASGAGSQQASATETSSSSSSGSSSSSNTQQLSTNAVSQSRILDTKAIAVGLGFVVAGYLFIQ